MASVTIEVHPIRLTAQCGHAEMMAKHGIGLARNAGTVTSIRNEYGLPASVRTWAQLATELRKIKTTIDAQIAAHHSA